MRCLRRRDGCFQRRGCGRSRWQSGAALIQTHPGRGAPLPRLCDRCHCCAVNSTPIIVMLSVGGSATSRSSVVEASLPPNRRFRCTLVPAERISELIIVPDIDDSYSRQALINWPALYPGESVVWRGKPIRSKYTTKDAKMTLAGVPVGIFITFWMSMALKIPKNAGLMAWLFPAFGILFRPSSSLHSGRSLFQELD